MTSLETLDTTWCSETERDTPLLWHCYLLVVFPDIWTIHLHSFPISLELKGRTLTATFTEAPAMAQCVHAWVLRKEERSVSARMVEMQAITTTMDGQVIACVTRNAHGPAATEKRQEQYNSRNKEELDIWVSLTHSEYPQLCFHFFFGGSIREPDKYTNTTLVHLLRKTNVHNHWAISTPNQRHVLTRSAP